MSIYIETNWESLFKYGEELCGDKVEVIRKPDGVIVVLADGLGSGVKANILSTLTSKIVATMLSEGADIVETVETIASTLPVCAERGVAYSTFTILDVKNSGDCYMVEFDNPEALVLKHGKELALQKNELVIAEKTIKESRFQLKSGDMIVAFSDGAIHAGVGQLLNFGWQRPNIVEYLEKAYESTMTARNVTKLMLSACDSLYSGKPGDDTTFVTLKVRDSVPTYIMVGPPVEKGKDEEIVGRFMKEPGLKVVCGGTTSQIVSRVTGKPLAVKLEYIDPKVPPMGEIEGIDLVTEGVITLSQVNDLMNLYCAKSSDTAEVVRLDGRDAASKLAKMLLEKSTEIHFMVGRAINPAHQNPDLPIDLGLKLRIVRDIASTLKSLGKETTVEYY